MVTVGFCSNSNNASKTNAFKSLASKNILLTFSSFIKTNLFNSLRQLCAQCSSEVLTNVLYIQYIYIYIPVSTLPYAKILYSTVRNCLTKTQNCASQCFHSSIKQTLVEKMGHLLRMDLKHFSYADKFRKSGITFKDIWSKLYTL